jgi:phospholipid/cholesterol/gamma-HCH transport system substrate-binding protein
MAAKERGMELKVGALIVVAVLLLIGFVVALGNFSLRGGYRFFVDFDFSGSLQPGAPVKISGIKVGKVERVDFWGGRIDPQAKRRVQVRVAVWVDESAREAIRSDAEFFINTAGVLGEQYLEVQPGDFGKPPLSAGAVVRGVDPPRTDLIVARLYEFLDSITLLLRDDKDVIKNVLEGGAHLITTLDGVLKENRADIGHLMRDLDRFTVEASGLAASVRRGVGDGRKIASTLANVEALSRAVRSDVTPLLAKANHALDGVGKVGDLVEDSDRAKIAAALDDMVRIANQVDHITADLQVVVASVRRGKGTAGALLVEPQIYDDLKELTRDLKRNPWKFFWKE